jgi:hypothetical protein
LNLVDLIKNEVYIHQVVYLFWIILVLKKIKSFTYTKFIDFTESAVFGFFYLFSSSFKIFHESMLIKHHIYTTPLNGTQKLCGAKKFFIVKHSQVILKTSVIMKCWIIYHVNWIHFKVTLKIQLTAVFIQYKSCCCCQAHWLFQSRIRGDEDYVSI